MMDAAGALVTSGWVLIEAFALAALVLGALASAFCLGRLAALFFPAFDLGGWRLPRAFFAFLLFLFFLFFWACFLALGLAWLRGNTRLALVGWLVKSAASLVLLVSAPLVSEKLSSSSLDASSNDSVSLDVCWLWVGEGLGSGKVGCSLGESGVNAPAGAGSKGEGGRQFASFRRRIF